MILLSEQEDEEAADGNVSLPVREATGFCIPLLRSDCHPRTPAAVVAGREHRVLLSRRAWRVPHHSEGVATAHERLPRLGRCLCQQPQDPYGKAKKGVSKEEHVRPYLERM